MNSPDKRALETRKPKELSPASRHVAEEFVKRAQTRLADLETRREELRGRISFLQYLFKLFTGRAPAVNPPKRSADRLRAGDHPREARHSQWMNVGKSLERLSPTNLHGNGTIPVLNRTFTELRRACRIALMESDRPQSCDQIVQRIRRRESVPLGRFADPGDEVRQELHKMVEDHEVVLNEASGTELWQLNRE